MDMLSLGSPDSASLVADNAMMASSPSSLRPGHHRRRSSLSAFFGSLTGSHGGSHRKSTDTAVLAQNPMFSMCNSDEKDLSTNGSGEKTPVLKSQSTGQDADDAPPPYQPVPQPQDSARGVAARAVRDHKSAGDSYMLDDASMCSVLEESQYTTHNPDTSFPFPGDVSMCLTARTDVSNVSSSSGNCASEGDQSMICLSARTTHRYSCDAAPDESVDEIQFIKSQLQDMGKRFDYLEHWLGECKTPRPAAAGHH
mmetsp:Transcript_46299/g.118201  ORF Transcript_46299/g.118201 Transcript_46299/m.118201 type:complete len:254 (-) Transcript_46299:312-1073(-)